MKIPNLAFKLISLCVWCVIGLITVIFVFLIFLVSPVYWIDRKRSAGHWLAACWGQAIVFLNPFWSVKVLGRQNLDARKAYVIISNHQSMGDIIVLYFLNTHFKWLAKESVFSVPVLGWGMSIVGYIRLDRARRGSIREGFQIASEWLKKNVSVLFFPEGTRSETGQIESFKNGAFKLALQDRIPLLPVVISGTRDAIAKGSWVFRHKVNALISILPPIFPSADDDFSQLKRSASTVMTTELARLNPKK
jgi:1-acyl-sn-glycerol-3-phosphate acyltransferase